MSGPLLEVRDLRVHFPIRAGVLRRTIGAVRAVDGVSFEVGRGRTVGLVGESGSGKTTVARAIVRVNEPVGGSILLEGQDLLLLRRAAMRRMRRRVQMIFQDPYASLDPRQTVGQILAEPLRVQRLADSRAARRARVHELLGMVGLSPASEGRYPHEFSGGQRQRIGIARALAVEPDVIVCDEPVSALDVSIQAQIINLLADLQARLGLAYVFIAHDLAVVRQLAHTVVVMYLGRVVESGPAEQVYARPLHPYTRALMSAAPIPDARVERSRRSVLLVGDPPSPADPPAGCPFHTRCPLRRELGEPEACVTTTPGLDPHDRGPDHRAACHFASRPPTDTAPQTAAYANERGPSC